VGLRAGLDWCEKSLPTGIRSPDRPARRQSLYRLRYPAHLSISSLFKNLDTYRLPVLHLLRVHISSYIVFGFLQLCAEEENTRTFLYTNLCILIELVETERDCLENCKEHGQLEYNLLALILTVIISDLTNVDKKWKDNA